MAAYTPTQEENIVNKRHNLDMERALGFVRSWGENQPVNQPVDMSCFVAWAVSTTLKSTILLLSVEFSGLDTAFTRNTYSRNPKNPWLIFLSAGEIRQLKQHITQQWQEMQVPENQRERVNQIAKHIVYEWENKSCCCWENSQNGQFVLRPLKCDDSGNVRVCIKDINIWSHPPRDEPLYRVLEEEFPTFRQMEGNLKKSASRINKIPIDPQIPEERKAENLQRQKSKVREKFTDYYKFFRDLVSKDRVPTSYQYPTLQLAQRADLEEGGGQGAQPDRYGGTFAGVYQATDGEVHHKFPAIGYQARSIPSEEAVFNDLFQGLGLSYAEIVEGGEH